MKKEFCTYSTKIKRIEAYDLKIIIIIFQIYRENFLLYSLDKRLKRLGNLNEIITSKFVLIIFLFQ